MMPPIVKVPNSPQNSCFACGNVNPIGLHLQFFQSDEVVFTEVEVSQKYAGWENLTHGGILATIADETMAWTAIHLTKSYILTRGFQIDFLRPCKVGQILRSEGKITQWVSDREVSIEVKIYLPDKKPCAKAKGNLVLFSKKELRDKALFDIEYLEEFEKYVPIKD
jgi:uncharacterized protein (TIGR00369 family)